MTEGAMVYKQGSFDAPVIGYYKRGQKVRISNKVYGAFYRVRFKQGVIGFISDVDVVPERNLKNQGAGKTGTTRSSRASQAGPTTPPIFERWQFGFGLGYHQYRELIAKAEKQADVITYGGKLGLPLTFLDGPFFLDINFQYTSTPPEYWKDFGTNNPQGNLMLIDTVLMFHIDNFISRTTSVYIGAGPMVAYSIWTISTGDDSSFISEEVRAGGVFALGISHLIGPVALKIEPRYQMEKTNYFSVLSAIQYAF